MDAGYLGAYCGKNITCLNTMAVHWVRDYIGVLSQKYPEPQYTAVHIEGVGQGVEGDVKASVGVPDINRSGVCDKMIACVHPMYGSKYATAIGEAFWNLFFSKYTTKDEAVAQGLGTTYCPPACRSCLRECAGCCPQAAAQAPAQTVVV